MNNYLKGLLIAAAILLSIGLIAWPLGQHLAEEAGDLDGINNIIGFLISLLCLPLGILSAIIGLTSWLGNKFSSKSARPTSLSLDSNKKQTEQ